MQDSEAKGIEAENGYVSLALSTVEGNVSCHHVGIKKSKITGLCKSKTTIEAIESVLHDCEANDTIVLNKTVANFVKSSNGSVRLNDGSPCQ